MSFTEIYKTVLIALSRLCRDKMEILYPFYNNNGTNVSIAATLPFCGIEKQGTP
jgi:hypothetical protein